MTDGAQDAPPPKLDVALDYLFGAAYLIPTRGQQIALQAMIDYFGADDHDDLKQRLQHYALIRQFIVENQIHSRAWSWSRCTSTMLTGQMTTPGSRVFPARPRCCSWLPCMPMSVMKWCWSSTGPCKPPWAAHADWPFDMEAAEAMTRPPAFDAEGLVEDPEADIVGRVVDLGIAGELVGSCDASDPVWRLPHLRATSGQVDGRRYVGLGFGWRTCYRQLTWMARER